MEIDFKKYLTSGDVALVGVSGGADSMCLLSLIEKAKKEIDFDLIAVHVNHCLRGKESDNDEKLVQSYCKKHGIKFVCKKVDVLAKAKQTKTGIEDTARKLRYDVFDSLMKEFKANKLFIAHNLNDQAETCLMHILRGSSVHGASAMKDVSSYIYRPLINVSRAEIEKYNRENNIEFVKDSTNDSVDYTRNYIRNVVLKDILKVYPGAFNSLSKFAEFCKEDDEYISSSLPLDYLKKENNEVRISQEVFSFPPAVKNRLILKAFNMLDVSKDIDKTHVDLVLNLFEKQSGKKISLPYNIEAHKSYKYIALKKKSELRKEEVPFKIGRTEFLDKIIEVKRAKNVEFKKGKYYFDLSKVPFDAVFRNRKVGDKFQKVNCPAKSLSDYLTDRKIDKRLRDHLIVLADKNEVLFVENEDIADKVKVDKNSKDIYEVIIKKSN